MYPFKFDLFETFSGTVYLHYFKMNAFLLVFAAVVGVALCAPLTETEEATVRLVQKTHKLCK